MDALTPVQTYDFHTIRRINDFRSHLFIGAEWKPDRDIFIIGAMGGLLCLTNNRTELYLSISRNPSLKPAEYFVCLKRNNLFYWQRDQRQEPQGIEDLINYQWLPDRKGFYVPKDSAIYFKCGAMNKAGRPIVYDIFANVYWVEAMSQEHRPQPMEESVELFW